VGFDHIQNRKLFEWFISQRRAIHTWVTWYKEHRDKNTWQYGKGDPIVEASCRISGFGVGQDIEGQLARKRAS
jgi:hypothetical protein